MPYNPEMSRVPKIPGDKMEGPDGAFKSDLIKNYVPFSADCHPRASEMKLKVQEANKVRMANFRFPQPPYDRLYSWVTGMTVMTMELEQQETGENWQRLQSYVKICSEGGDGPQAALRRASESSYFSQSGKWASLCGKFEMIKDVMTQLIKTSPDQLDRMIQKFDIKENWPEGYANGLGDTIMFETNEQQPCLLHSLRAIMEELRAKKMYGAAVEELRLLTVPNFKPKWTPRMGLQGHSIRTNVGVDRRQTLTCSICAQPANVPFHHCNFCKESPSLHHGRCCPAINPKNQNAEEEITWGELSTCSFRSSTVHEKNSLSSWELVSPY